MSKTPWRAVGAATMLIASQAMAAQITVHAGEKAIFNFSAAETGDVLSPYINGVVLRGYDRGQTATGTIAYFAGENLSGGQIGATSLMSATILRYATLLDGFSILISVTSGSFTVDPEADFFAGDGTVGMPSPGFGGTDSRPVVTPPDPTPTDPTQSVPEPGSLLLAALAGLALTATRRRKPLAA